MKKFIKCILQVSSCCGARRFAGRSSYERSTCIPRERWTVAWGLAEKGVSRPGYIFILSRLPRQNMHMTSQKIYHISYQTSIFFFGPLESSKERLNLRAKPLAWTRAAIPLSTQPVPEGLTTVQSTQHRVYVLGMIETAGKRLWSSMAAMCIFETM